MSLNTRGDVHVPGNVACEHVGAAKIVRGPLLRAMVFGADDSLLSDLNSILAPYSLFEIQSCRPRGDIWAHMERGACDVLVVDIASLPGAARAALATALSDGAGPPVIAIARSPTCATHAFVLGAVDCVPMPLDPFRLGRAFERARHMLEPRAPGRSAARYGFTSPQERLTLRCEDRIEFVRIADIEVIIAERNYVRFITSSATYSRRCTLESVERRLLGTDLVRVQRSFIVNTSKVVAIERDRGLFLITLQSGRKVHCGRSYSPHLVEFLGNHISIGDGRGDCENPASSSPGSSTAIPACAVIPEDIPC